jgi:hypothetical protein
MTRWKAAGIHSLISAAIALLVGALLFALWYPPPYFHAAGADQLMLLLVGINFAIGPLLTLIIFRPRKWGLKFDLVTIGILQSAALVYGMSVVSQSRPIFLVGALDRFELVSANEITDADLAQGTRPEFRSRSWTGPRLAVAELPTSVKERNELSTQGLFGRDVQNMPKYYRVYAEGGKTLLSHAKSLQDLRQHKLGSKELISSWLHATGRAETQIRWVPIRARKTDMVMLLDASSATPLQALAIDPW